MCFSGAIPILLGFIDSPDAKLQEHAITAILNLSIHDVNKTALTVAGAIPALVEVCMDAFRFLVSSRGLASESRS
jgi:hypothetical protein